MRITMISLFLVFTSSIATYSQSRRIQKLKTDYVQSALLEFNNKKLPVNKWENKAPFNIILPENSILCHKKTGKNILVLSKT